MEDQHVGELAPQMQVWDDLGYKIGSVARRHTGVVEVKTGPFGLGTHFYVPESAIREVTEDGVFLTQSKDVVAREYRRKPEFNQ